MKSMKTFLTFLMLVALIVPSTLGQRRTETWQVLRIQDKEPALVYEVFLRAGTVRYLESSTDGSNPVPNSTEVPTVGAEPVLGYWTTKPQRGERIFGVNSDSTGFGRKDIAASDTGYAAAWVFRPDDSTPPSAVILGLRGLRVPAGGMGADKDTETLTIPARSIARVAAIFRHSATPQFVDFDQVILEGESETGGFFTVARNDTAAPITINVSGWTVVNTPVTGTKRHMTLSVKPVGNDVILVSGRFGSEPESFAAAVIITRTP